MKKGMLGLCLAVALSPALVNAQGFNSLYLGASAGKTELDVSGNVDNTDTGFKVFGGTRVNNNLAVEIFYTDLGQASEKTATESATLESQTVGAAFVGILPVTNDIEVFGKLGMHSWRSDLKITDNNSSVSGDEDGFDPNFGIGLALNIQQMSVRAEYERYKLDNNDIDMMSVGIAYRF